MWNDVEMYHTLTFIVLISRFPTVPSCLGVAIYIYIMCMYLCIYIYMSLGKSLHICGIPMVKPIWNMTYTSWVFMGFHIYIC